MKQYITVLNTIGNSLLSVRNSRTLQSSRTYIGNRPNVEKEPQLKHNGSSISTKLSLWHRQDVVLKKVFDVVIIKVKWHEPWHNCFTSIIKWQQKPRQSLIYQMQNYCKNVCYFSIGPAMHEHLSDATDRLTHLPYRGNCWIGFLKGCFIISKRKVKSVVYFPCNYLPQTHVSAGFWSTASLLLSWLTGFRLGLMKYGFGFDFAQRDHWSIDVSCNMTLTRGF